MADADLACGHSDVGVGRNLAVAVDTGNQIVVTASVDPAGGKRGTASSGSIQPVCDQAGDGNARRRLAVGDGQWRQASGSVDAGEFHQALVDRFMFQDTIVRFPEDTGTVPRQPGQDGCTPIADLSETAGNGTAQVSGAFLIESGGFCQLRR